MHFAASLPAWPHTDNAPYPMLVEYDVGDNPLRDLLVRNPIKPRERHAAGPGRARASASSSIPRSWPGIQSS